MEPTITKPRRPWLAALLSLTGSTLGQVYAGRLRRGVILWFLGALLLPIFALASISLPLGRLGFTLLLLGCYLAFPIYIAVDAYFLARQNRDFPLKRYQRWWIYVGLFIGCWLANIAAAYPVRAFIAEAFVMPNPSMALTIQPGDRILVDKLWYGPKQLRRNDVVVYHSQVHEAQLHIMRVVGLPGDEIEIADEVVKLNGETWDDQHAFIDTSVPPHFQLTDFGPIQVPTDSFFVLGDNRRMSMDSRMVGPIPLADLYGKARLIYLSRERSFPDPMDTSHYEVGSIRWDRVGIRLD